jgi:acyl carrier protein
VTADQVKALIASLLEPRLVERSLPGMFLEDGTDLRTEGLVDSLGFVQLISDLEQELGYSIDLSELDAEHLTNVSALATHVARQGSKNNDHSGRFR